MTESGGDNKFIATNKQIGWGQFGCVYIGVHESDSGDVPVAVKKISAERNRNTWESEIKSLTKISSIDQPNLVRLLSYTFRDDHVYLFMEYCNAGDLHDYVKKQGKLNDKIVIYFARQITAGMKALHSLDIAHRDLKPQNILLHHPGGGDHVHPLEIILKIADFGFSRILYQDQMTTSYLGTPSYMAPEVFRQQPHTRLSEIFGIGVILYFCRFNILPFPAKTHDRLKYIYDNKTKPTFDNDTDHLLKDLITRMLVFEPENRITFNDWFNHPLITSPLDQEGSRHFEFVGDGLCEYRKDDFVVIEPQKTSSPSFVSPVRTASQSRLSAPPMINNLFHFPSLADFMDVYSFPGSTIERSSSLPTSELQRQSHLIDLAGSSLPTHSSYMGIYASESVDDFVKFSMSSFIEKELCIELFGDNMSFLFVMKDNERKCFDRIMHYLTILNAHRVAIDSILEESTPDDALCQSLLRRTEIFLSKFYVAITDTDHNTERTFLVWKKAIELALRICGDIVSNTNHPSQMDEKVCNDYLYIFIGREIAEGCKLYLSVDPTIGDQDHIIIRSHSHFVRSCHLLFSLYEATDEEEDRTEYRDGIEMLSLLIEFISHKFKILRPV